MNLVPKQLVARVVLATVKAVAVGDLAKAVQALVLAVGVVAVARVAKVARVDGSVRNN